MSLASQLDANKVPTFNRIHTGGDVTSEQIVQANGHQYAHGVDSSGNYRLYNKGTGQHILKVSPSSALQSCAVVTHINNAVNPVSRTVADHATLLTSHSSSLTSHQTLIDTLTDTVANLSLEGDAMGLNNVLAISGDAGNRSITNVNNLSCNGNVTASNLTALQNRIADLETFNTKLVDLLDALLNVTDFNIRDYFTD